MKLYYSKGACSLAVRIVINEIGLTCDYEKVDLRAKKTETGNDFLAINPKGAVPTFLTDTNEVLTENSVIQQYLADMAHATQLLPAIGDFKRYRVLEWLNYVSTELHKGFSPLFNPALPQEIKDTIFIPTIKQKFSHVDKHLSNHAYLLGEQFTLPDAYLFVMLTWVVGAFKLDLNAWPNLLRYFAELQKRQSIHKSLQEEGLSLSVA